MINKRATVISIIIFVIALVVTHITVQAKPRTQVTIHVAEFTGYYPDSSEMEGGFRAYNGEWLDPSEYTVAAPSCVPIGARVTVGGTGGWRDGVTYRVNDRGGAIVVDGDGVYHIDILMSSKEQANKFGRQHGYIIIEWEE